MKKDTNIVGLIIFALFMAAVWSCFDSNHPPRKNDDTVYYMLLMG